jgi:triacylglycerol esterase/lipase EstA (alpha/beta hydrolase family)
VPAAHHIFLVPGFFGFDYLGDLAYFAHVTAALGAPLRAAGVEPRMHVVKTLPTASLRQRTALLVDEMRREAGNDDASIHLLGHSSGGLDARLAVTPDVALPGEVQAEPLARRVRSVVTVSTPHQGTPVAAFFSSLLGQQMLEVFSVATSYALRTGRLPAEALARMAAFFMRPRADSAPRSPALSALQARLLDDFSSERRAPLESFVEQIVRDQDLLPQITPAAMDLFNASTGDRPGVRYGSVVTRVPVGGLRGFVTAGLSPYAHASHLLFVCVSRLAARMPADRQPPMDASQRAALARGLGSEPRRGDNDGIVPTLSQPWGEVIRAVTADHLDAIGHFHHPTHVPPHFDWLTSGSAFTRKQFLALWEDVARFMLRA